MKVSEEKSATHTIPTIENNIYLNIFNGYPISANTPGRPNQSNSTKVLGKKIENQIGIQVADLSLPHKLREPVSLISLRKLKGTMSVTPRIVTENIDKTKPKKQTTHSPYKQTIESPNTNQKVNKKTEKKVIDKIELTRSKGKRRKSSPDKAVQEIEGKLIKSKRVNLELTGELRELLGLTKHKTTIPYSINRFQGKYQEIIPKEYKKINEIFENQKRDKEIKKIEARERAEKVKNANTKIRMINKSLPQRSNTVFIQPQEPKRKHKHIKRTSLDRLKEMGLEFVYQINPKRADKQIENPLLNDRQHNKEKAIKASTLTKGSAVKSKEEKARRKILVKKQQQERKEEELLKKQVMEMQQQRSSRKLKELVETQKRLREEQYTIKRKLKKKKKKVELKGSSKDVEKKDKMSKSARLDLRKERVAESDSEAAGKQDHNKLKREAIARKAQKIREQLIKELTDSNLHIQQHHNLVLLQPHHIHINRGEMISSIQIPEEKKHQESSRRSEENKDSPAYSQLLRRYEEEKQISKTSIGKIDSANNSHAKDTLLERIDEQFEIQGGNLYDQEEVASAKSMEKNHISKEGDDTRKIIQAIEEIEERNDEGKEIITDKEGTRQVLEEETKRINEQLKKELIEKDNIILLQAKRENELHKEYQEMLAKQNKELMDKVIGVAHGMQSAHTDQINSVIEKLTTKLEEISKTTKPLTESPFNNKLKEEEKFISGMMEESKEVSDETYKKLMEVLNSNEQYRKLKGVDEELLKEYKEKIEELKKYKMSPNDFEEQKANLDEWYQEENKPLSLAKKKLIANALKETANIIEEQALPGDTTCKDILDNFDPSMEIKKELTPLKKQQRMIIEKPHEVLNIEKTDTSKKGEPVNNIEEGVISISITNTAKDKLEEVKSRSLRRFEEKLPKVKSDKFNHKLSPKSDSVKSNSDIEIPLLSDRESFGDSEVPDLNTIERENQKLNKVNVITDQIYNDIIGSLDVALFPNRSSIPDPLPRPPRGIHTEFWNVESYIDEVFYEALKDPETFISSLSVPLNRDPLFVLGQIQNEDNDYFEAIDQVMTQPVLPVELYLTLERTRKIDSIEDEPIDVQHEALLSEWSNIHNKCVFDAINDALDYYRPYELKGPPLPWSIELRELTYRNGSTAVAQEIAYGVKGKVMSWAVTNAGMLQLPEEETEYYNGRKNRLDKLREERLESMLTSEAREMEQNWTDYELEETQVVLDIGDIILEQMTMEFLQTLIKLPT